MTEQIFSASEKYREVMRELRLRQHAYPRFIANRRIEQAEASRQIAIMQAIADDYRELAKQEPLPLFAPMGGAPR